MMQDQKGGQPPERVSQDTVDSLARLDYMLNLHLQKGGKCSDGIGRITLHGIIDTALSDPVIANQLSDAALGYNELEPLFRFYLESAKNPAVFLAEPVISTRLTVILPMMIPTLVLLEPPKLAGLLQRITPSFKGRRPQDIVEELLPILHSFFEEQRRPFVEAYGAPDFKIIHAGGMAEKQWKRMLAGKPAGCLEVIVLISTVAGLIAFFTVT